MTAEVKYWEWVARGETAEDCLEWLFKNHKDMSFYGGLHLWQECPELHSSMDCGGYHRISPKMLEKRLYSVFFCNDSVGIRFHDEILARPVKQNGKWQQLRKIRFPTLEAV